MKDLTKKCFIICPIGDDLSETRIRSDKFLKFIFNPVLAKYGYKSIRADQIPDVGIITTQIIKLIIECPLVIADLTDSNANVFYELAIRHAVGKPYIQVISKGQKIPFDISSVRTIEVDITDLNSVEKAKINIEKLIESFENGHKADSPVSIASKAKILQSDEELIDQIADKLSDLTSYKDYGFCKDDYAYDSSNKIDEISRKLWGFKEYSSINLEDLSVKMDNILNKLDDIKKGVNLK